MVKITGQGRVERRMDRLATASSHKLVAKALFVGASMIADEAALLITEGSISGKNHVPSKPGEPPNADTRQLDTSIHPILTQETGPVLKAEAVADAPHAVPLEVGTSKMAARPFMAPASRRKRGEAIELVRKAVAQTVRST